MEFEKLVKARHSVRAYLPREVEDSKINYVLECARLAPSAVNCQPWFFHVVKSAEAKEAVRRCYDREWFKTAPMYLLVSVNEKEAWERKHDGRNHADVDGAIATEHICLAAADAGLGSCWVCNFNPADLRDALNLPENLTPLAIIPIGYPADDTPREAVRKPLDEITAEL